MADKQKTIIADERSQQVSGQSAMITLGLTQVAVGLAIFIRRYLMGQPQENIRDLTWILFGSIIVYAVLRSYLGGILPVPGWKLGLGLYAGFSVLLFVILSIWFGLPQLSEWQNTILPVVVGPALMIGGYWLIAYLGKRRLEREIS